MHGETVKNGCNINCNNVSSCSSYYYYYYYCCYVSFKLLLISLHLPSMTPGTKFCLFSSFTTHVADSIWCTPLLTRVEQFGSLWMSNRPEIWGIVHKLFLLHSSSRLKRKIASNHMDYLLVDMASYSSVRESHHTRHCGSLWSLQWISVRDDVYCSKYGQEAFK
jgi:hypothetical protein